MAPPFTDVFGPVRLPKSVDEEPQLGAHHVRGNDGPGADGVPVVRRTKSDG